MLGEVEGQGMDVRVMAGALDIVETRETVEKKTVRLLEERGFDVHLRVLGRVGHMYLLECPSAVMKEIEAALF